MNTQEIDYVLSNDSFSHMYAGVFPIDLLPDILKPHQVYIVNLDTSEQEGSHWVCLQTFDAPETITYFDSFGTAPPLEMIPKLLSNVKNIVYSDIAVQSILSQYCGYHCLMVALLMERKFSLKDILINCYRAEEEQYLRNDCLAALVIHSIATLKERALIDWSHFFYEK